MAAWNESPPLVSVVCTCYNHAKYVEEAIRSVLEQTYHPIELFVVDNASEDSSDVIIENLCEQFPSITFIRNKENIGICKAFNLAAGKANGKYLVDLSADDVLTPQRIARQVDYMELLGDEVGMVYANAEEMDEKGNHVRFSLKPGRHYPSGKILEALLDHHFIPAPSTLFRRAVFQELKGYNETLAFEDFDFWVRCAFYYKIAYQDFISVKKRVLPNSLSTKFFSTSSDAMLRSTYLTFQWVSSKLQTEEQKRGYQNGLSYYYRQSVLLGHLDIANSFWQLRLRGLPISMRTYLCRILHVVKMNIRFIYRQGCR